MQIIFEIFVVRPGRAVDALQHLVARIAAPVGAGHLHELEYFELAGGRHMRPATQVDPLALAIQADGLVRGNAGDDLGLVVLAEVLEKAHRFVARHLAAQHREIALHDLGHLRFDRGEIFGREGSLVGEVVVETIFDHRADGHLRIGEQGLHGLREQVRRRVTDDLEGIGMLFGDDFERGIARDRKRRVDQFATDLAGERRFGKPRTDARGNLGHGHRVRVGSLTAVGQRDHRHVVFAPS